MPSTSFQSFKIHEFRNKRKKVPSWVLNYSQFNNNLVAAFTTNGAEQLVLPQFSLVLRMLKNTFTIFPVSS